MKKNDIFLWLSVCDMTVPLEKLSSAIYVQGSSLVSYLSHKQH